MTSAALDNRAGNDWLRGLYLLLGLGPWLFLLGFTAWEVIVPSCDAMRELWPPPNAAGHWIVFLGGPWLIVMALLTAGMTAAGYRVSKLALITGAAALATCLVLIVAQPLATSIAQDATQAECERVRLLQGNS